jgi:Ran-binding protein 1
LTEHATNVASAAASTAATAASNVGDSVFSMFGGGAKKEKKEEDEDRGDVSGSAKARKEAAAEENPEVRLWTYFIGWTNADSGGIG